MGVGVCIFDLKLIHLGKSKAGRDSWSARVIIIILSLYGSTACNFLLFYLVTVCI